MVLDVTFRVAAAMMNHLQEAFAALKLEKLSLENITGVDKGRRLLDDDSDDDDDDDDEEAEEEEGSGEEENDPDGDPSHARPSGAVVKASHPARGLWRCLVHGVPVKWLKRQVTSDRTAFSAFIYACITVNVVVLTLDSWGEPTDPASPPVTGPVARRGR
jgi:hypothetical protein